MIDKVSGLTMFAYSSETEKVEGDLVASFLTAMDSFVSEIGGEALNDINYKGLVVQGVYGEKSKIALFLSDPADQILKERLSDLGPPSAEGVESKT